MKIIALSLILLALTSAFPTPYIPESALEGNYEDSDRQVPKLQRQNAIRFPLSDSEDQTDTESNKIDAFEADKSYYYGMNSSFTDIYNSWNKENSNNEYADMDEVVATEPVIEEEVRDSDLLKESFKKAELAFEDLYDKAEATISELSKEAEERQTIFGLDKSNFKEMVKELNTNFDEMFGKMLQTMTQLSGQPTIDQTFFGVDKDTIKQRFNQLEENIDETFDEALLALAELSRTDINMRDLIGFDKTDIKDFVDLAESQLEGMVKDLSLELNELFKQDDKQRGFSNLNLNSDETDDQVDLEEVLLDLRRLFNETVEEKALFGSELSTKENSDENDSFTVDKTYFYGLDSSDDLLKNSEVDFDKVLIALKGLVDDAIEKGKLMEPELIDE